MHKTNVHKRPGFTLIELLVVIAIIGILSTIAGVTVRNARTRASEAKQRSDLNAMRNAIRIHSANRDDGALPNPAATTLAGFKAALSADIDFDESTIIPPNPGRICLYRDDTPTATSGGADAYLLYMIGVGTTLADEGINTSVVADTYDTIETDVALGSPTACPVVTGAIDCSAATVYCLGQTS